MAREALFAKCHSTNWANWLNLGQGDFSKKVCGSSLGMLDEFVLVPDIFDPSAYSNPSYIDMCLPHLKDSIMREALVRDLCAGGWSQFCRENSSSLHRLCKEILRKLSAGNRLRRFPRNGKLDPTCAAEWCQEAI